MEEKNTIKDLQLFTIEEFRKYLESQDSLGDIYYFLTPENIRKANEPEEEVEED